MKNVIGFFSVWVVLFLIMWGSAPSDWHCYNTASNGVANQAMELQRVTGAQWAVMPIKVLYQVHNYYAWKTVTNNVTGKLEAIGIFGTVIKL